MRRSLRYMDAVKLLAGGENQLVKLLDDESATMLLGTGVFDLFEPREQALRLFAKVLDNARHLHAGLSELGLRVVEPTCLPDGTEVVTPVVPVVVGDDWKAAFLWKALYDAGVFVNVALHPAVPPAGALLRTSVMATHDSATLDEAIAKFAEVKRAFESEHGPLPEPV